MNVMEPHDYAALPDFERDPHFRKRNLWSYIDARDAAQAIRRALEAPFKGAGVFVIANSDIVMARPTSELLSEIFPDVPLKKKLGPNETLLSIEKRNACWATNRSIAGAILRAPADQAH